MLDFTHISRLAALEEEYDFYSRLPTDCETPDLVPNIGIHLKALASELYQIADQMIARGAGIDVT